MRFRPLVVFFRLCGACGLGVFLGAAVAGLVSIVTGWAFADGSQWLLGWPVLAILGALTGFCLSWITRRWFVPSVPRRRLLFTTAGLVALPLAVVIGQGDTHTAVTFPLVTAGAAVTVTLWVRGFRRETALARTVMYGYRRPARR